MLFHQILLSESKLGRNMFSIFYAAAPSLPWTTITKVLQKTTWQRDETIFIFKVYVSSPRHGWFCEHFWSVLYLWDRNVIRCTLLTSWPIYIVTPIMNFRLIYSIKISKRWWHLGYLIMVTFLSSLWSLYDFRSGRNKFPYTLGLKIKQICSIAVLGVKNSK